MNDTRKFSLGGFPPIFEIITSIKKKEKAPSSILSIKTILSKRNLIQNSDNDMSTQKRNKKGVKG